MGNTASTHQCLRMFRRKRRHSVERDQMPSVESELAEVTDQSTAHGSGVQGEVPSRRDEFLQPFDFTGLISANSCSTVYSAIRRRDSFPVALKVVPKEYIIDWEEREGTRIPKEIRFLSQVSDVPGVLHLLDWFEDEKAFFLILERPKRSLNLFNFIPSNIGIHEEKARKMFGIIVEAVLDCIEAGVFHRDIKHRNIIVDMETEEPKLIDFGLGCTTTEKCKHYPPGVALGARKLLPPETESVDEYDPRGATVWSLGLVLYFMIFGNIPLTDISKGKLALFSVPTSPGLRDFLRKCFNLDPTKRMTLENMLQHPWFHIKLSSAP